MVKLTEYDSDIIKTLNQPDNPVLKAMVDNLLSQLTILTQDLLMTNIYS